MKDRKKGASMWKLLSLCLHSDRGGVEALIGALAIAGRIGTSVLIAACIAACITSMDTQTLGRKKWVDFIASVLYN